VGAKERLGGAHAAVAPDALHQQARERGARKKGPAVACRWIGSQPASQLACACQRCSAARWGLRHGMRVLTWRSDAASCGCAAQDPHAEAVIASVSGILQAAAADADLAVGGLSHL
jgi:hypothetical protein